MARINVPTVENLMNELGLTFQKIYSNDFKVDKRSQWYMFMFPIVYLFTLKMQGIQNSLDQNNIWKAEGTNLDDLNHRLVLVSIPQECFLFPNKSVFILLYNLYCNLLLHNSPLIRIHLPLLLLYSLPLLLI